mgnify:CR=1 FL=1
MTCRSGGLERKLMFLEGREQKRTFLEDLERE